MSKRTEIITKLNQFFDIKTRKFSLNIMVPKRYFINNLPDYEGGDVNPDKDKLISNALALVKTIREQWHKTPQNCDGGLYVGISGAAYMLYRLSKSPNFAQEKDLFLQEAVAYLNLSLEYASSVKKHGQLVDKAAFILGNAGTYAIAAAVHKSIGNSGKSQEYLSEFAKLAAVITPKNWLSCGGDELLVGRAGYLSGLLWLRSELGCEVLEDSSVNSILDVMVESGQQYSSARRSPIPLMYQYYKTEYLGAAHGLAGILLMMLSFPSWLESRPQANDLLKKSVDALLNLQTASGNFPCAMDELDGSRPPEEELVHWCHGAPGTIYLLAKAYMIYKDKKYLDSCLKCGEITWHKGLLKKGPGICHGIAGSGYVFLTLYRLTGDKIHLHRALQFSDFLYSKEFVKARTPDSPYSLYEGLSGTVCFIADLVDPQYSSFPLFNIF
ncbi:lanC-like protein 3 [Palaemon carinicauda]|uniref:lanC-like protein 3 n=1 Tax=Palaemon carinicauda TaxID=392227 RepID=UPI0035B5B523